MVRALCLKVSGMGNLYQCINDKNRVVWLVRAPCLKVSGMGNLHRIELQVQVYWASVTPITLVDGLLSKHNHIKPHNLDFFSICFWTCVRSWDRPRRALTKAQIPHAIGTVQIRHTFTHSHFLVSNLTSIVHTSMTNLAILVRFGKTSTLRLLRWQPHPTLFILTISSKIIQ